MDTSESTFSAAKLREFIVGELKQNNDLYSHTGIVDSESNAHEILSFMESIYRPKDDLPHDLESTKAATTLRKTAATKHVGEAVDDTTAFAVGLTEQEADISPARAFGQIQSSIINDNSPFLSVFFGFPNSGKTSLALLYSELWENLVPQKYGPDRAPVIMSNAGSLSCIDHHVTNIEEFRSLLFGTNGWFESNGSEGTPPEIHPETPVLWIFDECSTHLDARTNSYEVANQYTPLLKRFAKINTDAIHIGHTGKDIHAELRRPTLTTEFVFKRDKKTADVYRSMDDDEGTDLKYRLENIPDTERRMDPNDLAPWSWD